MPKLTAIAAVARNGVIGDGAGLLWHLPEDFARFKAVTMGGALVMGRRTYQSLGRPLPGRTSIILTRDAAWQPGDTKGRQVFVVHSVDDALKLLAQIDANWWAIGGGETYRALWPYTTNLDLTLVDAEPAGAVTFPELGDEWRQTGREPHNGFAFAQFERRDDSAAKRLAIVATWSA